MVKLRLQRFGTKKRPFYRIVAADSKKKRDGRYLEIVGLYDPTEDPTLIDIDGEKAIHWLLNGASPSDTVKSLLKQKGIYAEYLKQKKQQG
jgi:small subunit ribosomal protein S16